MTKFRYDHVHLRSPDPEATASWYAPTFGAEPDTDLPSVTDGTFMGRHLVAPSHVQRRAARRIRPTAAGVRGPLPSRISIPFFWRYMSTSRTATLSEAEIAPDTPRAG